ncbi:Hsp33 family molecular chaperone HslO [Teredinibacter franksiae]|uniref:Hsp33 family molecular chaperone HslO n=1 Tax=Teredinibacter franksiae TaxID=2761453 RepID=UPI001628033D|nr:Hsp33 family molecular chaperone HslO [Teredinibacter franksiae]
MSNTLHDKTHRFIFDNTDLRGQLVSLQESYQKVLLQQQLPPVLLPVLGEFIAAVALLSEVLKFEGILTLQVRGDGLVPLIMAEANDSGHVRGIMNLRPDLTENGALPDCTQFDISSLKKLVGEGVLTMTVDPQQGERYQGIVPLEGESLGDSLAHYFEQSEQLPTRIWLFANNKNCGGLMLQSLPAQKVKDHSEREQQWNTTVQLANTVTADELFQLAHEQLLYRLFNEFECRVFPAREIQFRCSCSRQRSENAIASLGKQESFELLQEKGKIGIDCQFCGKHYSFNKNDLEGLFGGKEGSNGALH